MRLVDFTVGKVFVVKLTPCAHNDLCGCTLRPNQDGCYRAGIIGSAFRANRKEKQKVVALATRIDAYADGAKIKSPDNFNKEGDGFFALKAGQLRAYFWLDGELLIISHFVKKKQDKLAAKDKELMLSHKRQWQEGGVK